MKGIDCMNNAEIERLKYVLTNLVRQGCRIKIPTRGVDGRVVGVGFKPYWTNPIDSKIDRLVFDIIDNYGRIVPFYINYITGYDVLSQDGSRFENAKSISLDIYMYSPNKAGEKDSGAKVQLEIASEPVN